LARLSPDVDSWLDEEVFRAWNILVGERMKGGKRPSLETGYGIG
jgi:hypothetical protein